MAMFILSVVFIVLAFNILLNPIEGLGEDGIDLSKTGPSGLAEIRAFYFGTLTTLGLIFMRYGALSSDPRDNILACYTAFEVLILFVAVRCFSYVVDGPPELTSAYAMWGAEVFGSVVSMGCWTRLKRIEGSSKKSE